MLKMRNVYYDFISVTFGRWQMKQYFLMRDIQLPCNEWYLEHGLHCW